MPGGEALVKRVEDPPGREQRRSGERAEGGEEGGGSGHGATEPHGLAVDLGSQLRAELRQLGPQELLGDELVGFDGRELRHQDVGFVFTEDRHKVLVDRRTASGIDGNGGALLRGDN